jgi:hypothetical protein
MNQLSSLRAAIEESWSADTAYPDVNWSSDNPARGQCVVTALVVQHYMGGELEKLTTVYDGRPESHYRNVISDGSTVDLTSQQYPANLDLAPGIANLHGYASIRDRMLHEPDTKRRYDILLGRVGLHFGI